MTIYNIELYYTTNTSIRYTYYLKIHVKDNDLKQTFYKVQFIHIRLKLQIFV